MQRCKWKIPIMFVEGIAMSIAAQVAAWVAMLSIPAAWKFIGHVAGVVWLHLLALGS
jgi:hypothetical protein